jgi:hypothetical protein
MRRRRNCLILWSGLSESNRHLNLGKVPYYHYTKAAQRPSFYNMTAGQRQAFHRRWQPKVTIRRWERSRNLGNPSRLYDRRAALPLGESVGLILVRVHAAKLLPVGIEDADEPMMMFAAAIFLERRSAPSRTFFRLTFCHVGHPLQKDT